MKRLVTSLCLTVALLFGCAGVCKANVGYLEKAEQYTVKIRTRVKYPPMEDEKGSFEGAGFLIDSKRGWIATNAHVSSRNPESVEIAFKDKAFTDAKLIFVDQYLDLAVLKISTKDIPKGTAAAKLNCTQWPKVGSKVGAYGHPLSLDFSVTTGIVSGLRYRHNVYSIQTDAAINSGNSGGPLIDENSGAVIGINEASYSKKTSEGLGFAVPMVHACRAFNLLEENKNPSPSYLPVAFARGDDFPNQLLVAANFKGLPVSWPLKAGDKLVSLVNAPEIKLKNQAGLIHALRGKRGEIPVNILRGGKEKIVKLKSLPRPKLTDWVGLHFSGVVVGNETFRDKFITNPNNEIIIHDVADASIGSVSDIKAYRYISTVDGVPIRDIKSLCNKLKASKKKKVKFVLRSRRWDYMAASKYSIHNLEIKNLKLVGPQITETTKCHAD